MRDVLEWMYARSRGGEDPLALADEATLRLVQTRLLRTIAACLLFGVALAVVGAAVGVLLVTGS